MPNWPIDRLEVVDPEYRDVDPEVSNIPDLVDWSEAADLLGVSRQRVHGSCAIPTASRNRRLSWQPVRFG